MSEMEHFRNATRFMTILPVRSAAGEIAPDWLTRCLKYSPLVGIGIGIVSGIVLLIATELWNETIAAMLAVATSIALTGALHEDGFADTFDGFGGGFTVEKRLTIMKDSRIGTYGALALGLNVALRIAALAVLTPWQGVAALIAAHAAARAAPAWVMTRLSYTGDVSAMKVAYTESRPRIDELQLGLIFVLLAILPLTLISAPAVAFGALLGAALAALLALWARRLIGGYTGDVLGGIEQAFEIGFLLGVAALLG
ncbi:MAG: adenosylcobinamide-GDP ribazoletransferase [Rhizobiales bacterium]|nr:adenosylcobinamide-GDP ribazoletransferase [Hyphomicrobiales bacterium]MBN8986342.1 adenosylcobinamide-GDP ribazoletransferase [Hyphomicrobiales bacterium]